MEDLDDRFPMQSEKAAEISKLEMGEKEWNNMKSVTPKEASNPEQKERMIQF